MLLQMALSCLCKYQQVLVDIPLKDLGHNHILRSRIYVTSEVSILCKTMPMASSWKNDNWSHSMDTNSSKRDGNLKMGFRIVFRWFSSGHPWKDACVEVGIYFCMTFCHCYMEMITATQSKPNQEFFRHALTLLRQQTLKQQWQRHIPINSQPRLATTIERAKQMNFTLWMKSFTSAWGVTGSRSKWTSHEVHPSICSLWSLSCLCFDWLMFYDAWLFLHKTIYNLLVKNLHTVVVSLSTLPYLFLFNSVLSNHA